jgi:hypothetical protein
VTISLFTILFLAGTWYLYTLEPNEDGSEVHLISEITQTSVPILDSDVSEKVYREVTVFVGDPLTGTLMGKIREIETNQGVLHEISQTIQHLIYPEPDTRNETIPEDTELLSLFVTNTGIIYLNFNRHIQDRHAGGLSAELTTVTSVVNTLLFNFKEIRQVQILVEGSEIDTLAGHVDCRKPFSKMLLMDS